METGQACSGTAGSTSKKCSSLHVAILHDIFYFQSLHVMFCRYVPILGWAWGLSDTIFLERNWEKDEVQFDLIKIIRLVLICR